MPVPVVMPEMFESDRPLVFFVQAVEIAAEVVVVVAAAAEVVAAVVEY